MSPCGLYRLRLGRRWSAGETVLWIMLNPSTANAYNDDATIRRCIAYSRVWGFGAMSVGNVFAYRATNPSELMHAPREMLENYGHIHAMSLEASLIVCAWGANPLARFARAMVSIAIDESKTAIPVRCLGISPSGAPFHPLQRTRKLSLPTLHHLTDY